MSMLLRADANSARADGSDNSAAGMLVCGQAALDWVCKINVAPRCTTRRDQGSMWQQKAAKQSPWRLAQFGNFIDDKHH